MADIAIVASEVAATPQDYTLPGAQEILLRAVGCQVNGSAAAGAFLPALQMLDPAGHVMWTAVNESRPIAAGGTALLSWFPGGGVDNAGPATSSAPSSALTAVSSVAGTLTVTSPTGPTANVDMPNTGVGAGTYGDSTHTSRVTVDVNGRVTSASSVAISGSGGAGGLIVLYDSGYLGADTATIDTGAGGIASGHVDLEIVGYLRSTNAGGNDNVVMTLNNDASAIYSWQRHQAAGASGTASSATALTSELIGTVPGSTAAASYFGTLRGSMPAYDNTSNFKTGHFISTCNDNTAGNTVYTQIGWAYGSASAISRVAIAPQTGGAKFKAGSRLIIYGIQ